MARLIRFATVEKPRFEAGSVLLYVGAFVTLGASYGMIAAIDSAHGHGPSFIWSLVSLAVLAGLIAGSYGARLPVPAGLLAFVVAAFTPVWLVTLERWAGVWSRDYQPLHARFHWSWASVELVTVLVSLAALLATRFPLIGLPLALSLWYLVADNAVALFLGSSPTTHAKAEVTLVVGLVMMGAGVLLDGTRLRLPSFWLHLVGLGSFAGGVGELWHDSDGGWAGIMLVSLLGIVLSVALRRAAYAVYGAAGLLYGAVHFLDKWIRSGFSVSTSGAARSDDWKAWLAYGLVGLALMVVGVLAAYARDLRRGAEPKPTPVEAAAPDTQPDL